MSETRFPLEPEHGAGPGPRPAVPAARAGDGDAADVEPLRLRPLQTRRPSPWLIVEVDGTSVGHGALVWALREAARREAMVVAVHVLDDDESFPLPGAGRPLARDRTAAHDRLEAHLLRAIAETGVHGRSRTAVLERPVFEALSAATRGADLVVVGSDGKHLLRHAVPRPLPRRLARGA